jgi:CarD family transcriptional regulator
MAARKKVTKKASKSSTGSNQGKRKVARAPVSKAKSNRSTAPAAAKAQGSRARSRPSGKRSEAETSVAKKGVSVSHKTESSASMVRAKESAAKSTQIKASAAKGTTAKASGRSRASEPKAKVVKDARLTGEVAKTVEVTIEIKRTIEVKIEERTASDVKVAERGNAKGAESQPARVVSAAAGVTAQSAKAVTEAAVRPASTLAASAAPEGQPKAAKTSAAAKPETRDTSGGEQKTMKNSAHKHGFKLNEFVVYPAHGVGQIVGMEEQEVAGFKLELFVINFVKDKMTLRVPIAKVAGVGMRKLSDPEAARRSLEILTGRARIKRTMWSRRAQEYEAKINSGDINAIAEVVRDLYRSEAQPEQSYSERQLYEAALDRMMREIAAVHKVSETEAMKLIEVQLKKNQKRGAKADAGEGEDAGIEEAA